MPPAKDKWLLDLLIETALYGAAYLAFDNSRPGEAPRVLSHADYDITVTPRKKEKPHGPARSSLD